MIGEIVAIALGAVTATSSVGSFVLLSRLSEKQNKPLDELDEKLSNFQKSMEKGIKKELDGVSGMADANARNNLIEACAILEASADPIFDTLDAYTSYGTAGYSKEFVGPRAMAEKIFKAIELLKEVIDGGVKGGDSGE